MQYRQNQDQTNEMSLSSISAHALLLTPMTVSVSVTVYNTSALLSLHLERIPSAPFNHPSTYNGSTERGLYLHNVITSKDRTQYLFTSFSYLRN